MAGSPKPEPVEAKLEIRQANAEFGHDEALGHFELEIPGDAKPAIEVPTGEKKVVEVPASPIEVEWKSKRVQPFANAKLSLPKSVELKKYQRNLTGDFSLRTRGGAGYRWKGVSAHWNRGGYALVAADTPDADLVGKGGVEDLEHIVFVRLDVVSHARLQDLFILFPDTHLHDFLYGEFQLDLSCRLIIGDRHWEVPGPRFEQPAHPFRRDSELSKVALKKELRGEYGDKALGDKALRPRDFQRRFLQGESELARSFLSYVRDAEAFLESKIGPDEGFRVTATEIACNMLSEGGNLELGDAIRRGTKEDKLLYNGYADLGIDVFVTAYKGKTPAGKAWPVDRLPEFTHASIKAYIDDGEAPPGKLPGVPPPKDKSNILKELNEKSQKFESFYALTLRDAVYASAALLARAKYQFARDVSDPDVLGVWATRCENLPEHVQYYWTTLNFNLQHRTPDYHLSAQRRLQDNGLEWHDVRFMKPDDDPNYPANSFDPKFNASWRTATYRFMRRLVPELEKASIPPPLEDGL